MMELDNPRIGQRWFSTSIAIFLLILIVAAFAPSLIDQSGRNVPLPLTRTVMAHTIIGTAWVVLFVVQTTLIATRRIATHRALGVVGALLAAAFVLTGPYMLVEHARRGFDLSGHLPPVDAGFGMAPLVLFAWFGALVGAALIYRQRRTVHKRLMLMAAIGGLSGTPLVHLVRYWHVTPPVSGLISVGGPLLLVGMVAIHDRLTDGRIHPVTLWVVPLMYASALVFLFVVVPSAPWQQFSIWLTS